MGKTCPKACIIIFLKQSLFELFWSPRRKRLGGNGHTRFHLLDSLHYDTLSGLEALVYYPEALEALPWLDGPYFQG